MKPLIIILNGDTAGQRLSLEDTKRYILGRDQSADICLPEKKISRRHASVCWDQEDGRITIEDLGSLNGTSVNGEIISGQHELRDGDRVQIGSFLLQVQVPESSNPSLHAEQTDRKRKSEKQSIPAAPAIESIDAAFEASPNTFTGGRIISGKLQEISLADLLQMLSTTKKSGCLVLSQDRIESNLRPTTSSQPEAFLYMNDGDIEYAYYRGMEGEDAFFECLHLNSGFFALFPFDQGEDYKRVITSPLEALLLEGFRRLDEQRANQAKISDNDVYDVNPNEPLGSLSSGELAVFQSIWKHRKLSEVINSVSATREQTLEIVKKLIRGGFISKAKKAK